MLMCYEPVALRTSDLNVCKRQAFIESTHPQALELSGSGVLYSDCVAASDKRHTQSLIIFCESW